MTTFNRRSKSQKSLSLTKPYLLKMLILRASLGPLICFSSFKRGEPGTVRVHRGLRISRDCSSAKSSYIMILRRKANKYLFLVDTKSMDMDSLESFRKSIKKLMRMYQKLMNFRQ